MFEIAVARKYLIPKLQQFSTSIISLISILVISLVVWLIVVFFSVTNGLQEIWIDKLIALTAPVRLTPTEAYFHSYYYRIDHVSESSDYAALSIFEKRQRKKSDPYDPSYDSPLPAGFPQPDTDSYGRLKDLVKEAFSSIEKLQGVEGLYATEFEMAFSQTKLRLAREYIRQSSSFEQTYLTHTSYLGSFDGKNPKLRKSLIKLRPDDALNLLNALSFKKSSVLKSGEHTLEFEPLGQYRKRVASFFRSVNFKKFQVPEGERGEGTLILSSIKKMKKPSELLFSVEFTKDNHAVKKTYSLGELTLLEVEKVDPVSPCPFWVDWNEKEQCLALPNVPQLGEAILLPKNFQKSGALVGDQGYLSYQTASATAIQEQKVPYFVAGFYDPGVMPIGGKFLIVDPSITTTIRSNYDPSDHPSFSGIYVHFNDLDRAEEVKEKIVSLLSEKDVGHYWNVETYEEYDFTRDMIQQLKSEKNLFSLISIVIIIVACSNIISMLIILVNDKKEEIAILRAMGATSRSIAIIFGSCGLFMGTVGSVIGVFLAEATLKNIDFFLGFLGHLQGHEVLNEHYFGDTLPSQISGEALLFVLIATALISLFSGMIPALKASSMNPSTILRSEG